MRKMLEVELLPWCLGQDNMILYEFSDPFAPITFQTSGQLCKLVLICLLFPKCWMISILYQPFTYFDIIKLLQFLYYGFYSLSLFPPSEVFPCFKRTCQKTHNPFTMPKQNFKTLLKVLFINILPALCPTSIAQCGYLCIQSLYNLYLCTSMD